MRLKRAFDVVLSAFLLTAFLIPICILCFYIMFDTARFPFFFQTRIGRDGKPFNLLKLRTVRGGVAASYAGHEQPGVTRFGNFLRRTKLNELPQIANILIGDMSFVGPRPDVKKYADSLRGKERTILLLRPGLTGPASLVYFEEETLLRSQKEPEAYYDNEIWPDKVRLNRAYIENWSFTGDLKILFETVVLLFRKTIL
ncbi:sugar transferase [Ascidiimonas aurantiaca]|uniref:sugar transferase n=1 Tax=Ascidiimonas aurantiaca TaxID=1685432 RepID=UPI0030EC0C9C